jgi:hypothetical protein
MSDLMLRANANVGRKKSSRTALKRKKKPKRVEALLAKLVDQHATMIGQNLRIIELLSQLPRK